MLGVAFHILRSLFIFICGWPIKTSQQQGMHAAGMKACMHATSMMKPFQQNYEDILHTHFGVPLGNTSGWWDDRKRNQKPVLPLYLRLDIPSNLSRALSCLCLSGHNFLVQRMRHDRNRRPYELRICDRLTGTLFRMRNTFCWTVRMNIWSDFAHSNSLSSHLSLRMAHLVWGPLWTNLIFLVLPLL